MTTPAVFISYSRDSEEHHDAVLRLAWQLRAEGVNAWLDSFVQAPLEGWPRWTESQFTAADYILLVCSPRYRESFERSASTIERGVAWEGMLAAQHLFGSSADTRAKLIPVLLGDSDSSGIPTILRPFTNYRLPQEYNALYRHLTAQPEFLPIPLGPLRLLPTRNVSERPAAPRPSIFILSSQDVDPALDVALHRDLSSLGTPVLPLAWNATGGKMPPCLEPASYLLYLCTTSTAGLIDPWMPELGRHDIILAKAVIDEINHPNEPLRIGLRTEHAATDLAAVTEFFRRELAPAMRPIDRHPALSLMRDASRRELRLVARHCIDETVLDSFLFDAEIERGRIRGASLHERLIDLLHVVKAEGLLQHFAEFLADERPRCVQHQLERLRYPTGSGSRSERDDERPVSADGGGDRVVQEGEDRALEELTKVFQDRDLAMLLLARVSFPAPRIPSATTSLVFWNQVAGEARNGVLPGGIRPILAAAAEMYPNNPVFVRYRRSRPSNGSAQDENQTHPTSGSPLK